MIRPDVRGLTEDDDCPLCKCPLNLRIDWNNGDEWVECPSCNEQAQFEWEADRIETLQNMNLVEYTLNSNSEIIECEVTK